VRSLIVLLLVLAVGTAGGAYYLRPRTLVLSPKTLTPVCCFHDGQVSVTVPGAALVATVAVFDDELYAYFNYDYLRSRRASKPAEVLLTYAGAGDKSRFPIVLHPGDDLMKALPFLAGLVRDGYIPGYEWRFTSLEELKTYRQQTAVFVAAYNLPVRRSLEGLTPAQKQELVRRFVIFKSRTDPRIRKGILPVPPLITGAQAQQLAADIITVADFFWLPLDFFLGIGAMENNYMDVPGDLNHAVWKRRAQPGDIILERRSGRVLVRNSAAGVWQITRETLRYAHKLYLEGKWDYSLLPERLRPPEELKFDQITAGQLTTYAGLLFRDLLDRFGGNVAKAVGAYNGGPGNPNMRYEQGVRLVANYARRTLEQAARLNGEAVTEMSFLAPSRNK